ncbi:polysaccharide pyruvyl transferase family protein [Peptostreptococcaceae bacterium AGR-M142]
MKKIVLMGYYGRGNFGDDLMLYNITKHLNEDYKLHVLTSNVNKTYVFGENVMLHQTFQRAKLKNLALLINAFFKKDYLIWGGGTCFSDQDGVVSPMILLLARLFGLKIVFMGVGANPIKRKKNVFKMGLISRLVDRIYVRDSKSQRILESFFKSSIVEKSEDIAYLYEFHKSEKEVNRLVISLRNLDNYLEINKIDELVTNIANFVDYLKSRICVEELIVLNLDDKLDTKINLILYNQLKHSMGNMIQMSFVENSNIEDKIEIIQNSRLNILFRLHGIFVSVLSDVDTIGIGYSPKVKSFMDSVKAEGYIDMLDVIKDPHLLEYTFDRVLISNKLNVRDKVVKALKNFEFLEGQ